MRPLKVGLEEKLSLFEEYWSPKIVGELNGQHVKLVKLSGEFVWHHHEGEDEMFLVVKGSLDIEFRDDVVRLERGGDASGSSRGGASAGGQRRGPCAPFRAGFDAQHGRRRRGAYVGGGVDLVVLYARR